MKQIFLRMIIMITIIFSCLVWEEKVFMSTGGVYVGLAICSDSSTMYSNSSQQVQENFGHHAWIALTNMGRAEIKLNGILIPIGKTITVGTWHGGLHDGIFYNLERYYAEKNEFSKTESVYQVQLLQDFQLNLVLSELNNLSNDTWKLHNNCASFATRIWNLNAKTKISAGLIHCPANLSKNILKEGGRNGLILSSHGMGYYYYGKNPKAFVPKEKNYQKSIT